jgi:hypothetical protein
MSAPLDKGKQKMTAAEARAMLAELEAEEQREREAREEEERREREEELERLARAEAERLAQQEAEEARMALLAKSASAGPTSAARKSTPEVSTRARKEPVSNKVLEVRNSH